MKSVNAVRHAMRLDDQRWEDAKLTPLWSAALLPIGASLLITFIRFGPLVIDAPRAFTRMMLVRGGGWLGLAAGTWLLSRRVTDGQLSLSSTAAAVATAHTPVLIFGVVVLVAGGFADLQGPGFIAAVGVFGFWFPASLWMAAQSTSGLAAAKSFIVMFVPYVAWLAIVGRHLNDRIGHLL
jgi:hypothetical protein